MITKYNPNGREDSAPLIRRMCTGWKIANLDLTKALPSNIHNECWILNRAEQCKSFFFM